MQGINSGESLKEAIYDMETKHAMELIAIKDGIQKEYEKVKPVNFIKGIVHDVSQMPELKENIVGTGVGLAAGVIAKKLIVGSSINPVKMIAGQLLEVGMTTYAAKHSRAIKSAALSILTYLVRPRPKKVVYHLGEY
jgi:hypothetical protein